MVEYNSVFHVTSDCPVEDICDEIRSLNGSEETEIDASWQENPDDTITVTISGYTHTDELTLNYTPDTIEEQIDRLRQFPIVVPDQFLAVILGGY